MLLDPSKVDRIKRENFWKRFENSNKNHFQESEKIAVNRLLFGLLLTNPPKFEIVKFTFFFKCPPEILFFEQ